MTRIEEKQLNQFWKNIGWDLTQAINRDYGTDYATPARLAHAVWFGRAPSVVCSDARIVAAHGDAIRSAW